MTVSDEIDRFIAENGGNARDALNVALARLEMQNNIMRDLDFRLSLYVGNLSRSVSIVNDTVSENDRLVAELRARDEMCQDGPADCPFKMRERES